VPENRVEMVLPPSRRAAVVAAMKSAHPYEEPAFDIFALQPLPEGVGLGRIGALARPEPLSAFVSRVAAGLPTTSWGVRAAGDPDSVISRVAVCGGAGDSLLSAAVGADVQAYVTADLRHHPADEHRRASSVALVDVAHWASEYPWCGQVADVLRSAFGTTLPVRTSRVRTDPWNLAAACKGDDDEG
jgi:putative NIF3 family GTP cyclohydrolase 1 type 2